MLTVKELEPCVIDITLTGGIEASDIETMKRDLTPALEAEGRCGQYPATFSASIC